MIPKVINYCWFGHNDKPELFTKCKNSWKKYCPDYEIIEWNEDNFDINCCDYVKEAYEAGKWAFVTDYARLWIIYHHGGIYLDTDVEIIKSFDTLLSNKAFFGVENVGLLGDDSLVATGLGFGAVSKNIVVKKMLDAYEGEHFINENGTYNLTTCPWRNTNAILDMLPNDYSPDSIIDLGEAVLYPADYFCPLDARGIEMKRTYNTYSIHWYNASWLSSDEKVVHKYRVMKNKCQRIFGNKLGSYVVRAIYLFRLDDRRILKKS